MSWIAGWNIPNHPPDSIHDVNTWEEARAFLARELHYAVKHRDAPQAALTALEHAPAEQPFEAQAVDYLYWIVEG